MKRYEDVTKEVVTERECVEMRCDLCGRKAEEPGTPAFEWGGAGSASATLEWQYSIDDEYAPEERDLCYECAAAIAEAMQYKRKELLALIERCPEDCR